MKFGRQMPIHDGGLGRINIGIARYAFRAHGVSFRCCHWTFKINPYFL